jgi:hypothetical protein
MRGSSPPVMAFMSFIVLSIVAQELRASTQAPADESAPAESPIAETPFDDAPSFEAPTDESPFGDAESDDAPSSEPPFDEFPTDEASPANQPSEETPPIATPPFEDPFGEDSTDATRPTVEAPFGGEPPDATPPAVAPTVDVPINMPAPAPSAESPPADTLPVPRSDSPCCAPNSTCVEGECCEPATLGLPELHRLNSAHIHNDAHSGHDGDFDNATLCGAGAKRLFFSGTARFPRERCAMGVCHAAFDGVLIYEDMELRYDDQGRYAVFMNLSAPAMPVTLRLRLHVTATCEKCCPATLTLRPIAIIPANDSVNGQCLPGEWRVCAQGVSPSLASLAKCNCQVVVERTGRADYGDQSHLALGLAIP